MELDRPPARPPFAEAFAAWQALLGARGFPRDPIWLFSENLCFEPDASRPGGYRLGFQTAFTPPPPRAEEIAYDYFADFEVPLVFYRLGSCRGKSACVLLGDKWFSAKAPADGFVAREEWRVLFRPGPAEEVEEITEKSRYEKRLVRGRPLHDLDFCLTLRAVHETLAHGRVLSAYERSALSLLHLWRRVFGER